MNRDELIAYIEEKIRKLSMEDLRCIFFFVKGFRT